MNAGNQAVALAVVKPDMRPCRHPTDAFIHVSVAQGEAEAPVAPRQRGAGREENTGGSRAPTRAQLEQFKVWSAYVDQSALQQARRAEEGSLLGLRTV